MTVEASSRCLVRWRFVSVWLACISVACGSPRPDSSRHPEIVAEVDSLVRGAVEEGLIPGAVVLVSLCGETILHEAYGHRQVFRLESAGPDPTPHPGASPLADPPQMTPGTVFDLASVTKVAATTMAVMHLVDRGALDLDMTLSLYLPEFSGGDKDGITARHLLTHTSGLPPWQPLYYQAERPQEVLAAIASMPLDWGVGEERHYSDLGFMILGFLVEAVSGMPMDDFLSTELYGPLGLGDTGFKPDPVEGVFAATSHGNPYERRMVYDSMFGYRYAGLPESWNGWRRYTLLGEVNDGNAFHALEGVAGHAGLFSTAGDLKILLQVLLQEGSLLGRRYLRPETVRAFLEPNRTGQALGWRIPNWAPEGSFAHTGFTGTFVMGVPALDLALVLLTNRQNLGVDVNTGRYPDLGPLQEKVATAAVRAATKGAEG